MSRKLALFWQRWCAWLRVLEASTKRRVITFGKWIKEFTTGVPREITDRWFVAEERAFRVNDSLPPESVLRWEWQRGGRLPVDRGSGQIPQLSLPESDPFCCTSSWYRDCIACCGVSEDGQEALCHGHAVHR